jgi:CelD/BcsL family acetyltransferase involved in cellulose biosynthesis
MLDVDVIDELPAAEALAPEWDELAVACALPLCAPAWGLAWWRNLAPTGTELRIHAVRDGPRLVALAPWFIHPGARGRVDLRFLGAEISDRVDILCVAGLEEEAARALTHALGARHRVPDLVAFEAVRAASVWPRRLAATSETHPRARYYLGSTRPTPVVNLPACTPAEWFAGRSRNFRSEMGRLRRKVESAGGALRALDGEEERANGIVILLALHARRWEGRAATNLTRPGVEGLLREAAATLGPERLRLWVAELDGRLISVQLFVAAGGEVKYWNGGWSEDHAALKPSMLTILAALEDAISREERRLDLGAGRHPYKLRFANGEDALAWGTLVLRTRRWLRTSAEFAPRNLRYRAKLLARRLPPPLSGRLDAAARRVRG